MTFTHHKHVYTTCFCTSLILYLFMCMMYDICMCVYMSMPIAHICLFASVCLFVPVEVRG